MKGKVREQRADLMGELSYRNDITDDGKLSKQWRALFITYSDRLCSILIAGSRCAGLSTARYQHGEIMDYY